jgi:hypothetical protein
MPQLLIFAPGQLHCLPQMRIYQQHPECHSTSHFPRRLLHLLLLLEQLLPVQQAGLLDLAVGLGLQLLLAAELPALGHWEEFGQQRQMDLDPGRIDAFLGLKGNRANKLLRFY